MGRFPADHRKFAGSYSGHIAGSLLYDAFATARVLTSSDTDVSPLAPQYVVLHS